MDFELLNHNEDLIAEVNELIDTHLEENDPEITGQTFNRLVKDGYTDFQARNLISKCMAFELTSDRGFDEKRYSVHLSHLPDVNFEW